MKAIHFLLLGAWMVSFVFSPQGLFAQEADWFNEGTEGLEEKPKGKISGGIGHFNVAFAQFGLDGLNDVAEAQGYPALSSGAWFLGGDGTVVVANLVLRAGGMSSLSNSTVAADYTLTFRHRQNNFGLGYNLYSHKGLIVYPVAEFGRYENVVQVVPTTPGSHPVSSAISGTFVGTELRQKGYFFGVDLGLDYMIGFDESSGAGITFGLRGGYKSLLSDRDWTSYETALSSGPAVDLSGFYFQASLGLSGWHRQ